MKQMREILLPCAAMLVLLACAVLAGCGGVGSKSASFTSVYAVTSVVSFALLVFYCIVIKKRDPWFVLLFAAVLLVNVGYFSLSISKSLDEALLANRIAYLGSVMLPATMLMIILNVTRLQPPRFLAPLLIVLSAAVFLVAASPGYSDIYYEHVSLVIVNGTSMLEKTYGPWHVLYLFYLVGYFAAMIAVIAYAAVRKTTASSTHAIILAIAVLVNIGVWMLEQMVKIDFEFLSVSYIISELFLLGLTLAMREREDAEAESPAGAPAEHVGGFENARLTLEEAALVLEKAEQAPTSLSAENHAHSDAHHAIQRDMQHDIQREAFLIGLPTLTRTERAIYDLYLEDMSTKEIMATLSIKENTLKFHNKNLYGKLGVSSRKQLVEIARKL